MNGRTNNAGDAGRVCIRSNNERVERTRLMQAAQPKRGAQYGWA